MRIVNTNDVEEFCQRDRRPPAVDGIWGVYQ
jgi:hypothetical protein